jgi:hypothetical protein
MTSISIPEEFSGDEFHLHLVPDGAGHLEEINHHLAKRLARFFRQSRSWAGPEFSWSGATGAKTPVTAIRYRRPGAGYKTGNDAPG